MRSKVFVCHGLDRRDAVRALWKEAAPADLQGKEVLVKPNFNTADAAPGSTHNDTLDTVLGLINEQNPGKLWVGDRSGPADTHQVFEEKGVHPLLRRHSAHPLIFDDLSKDQFQKVQPPGSHWRNGFLFVKPVQSADHVIGLCTLKTHQFGGHFSLSLKLATGCVHRQNMTELHSSLHMRQMIAEINFAYRPDLMIMDGVESFFSGGPMTGSLWHANLSLASSDRVALDAVGVAALRMHGTTKELMLRSIFDQDQIRRAAELGLGVTGPQDIELVPVDDASEEEVDALRRQLLTGK